MYSVVLGDVCYGLNSVSKIHAELRGPGIWECDLTWVSEDDRGGGGLTPNVTGDETLLPILVHPDFPNKKSHRWGIPQLGRHPSLTDQELGHPRSRCQWIQCLVAATFQPKTAVLSPCPPTEKGLESSLASILQGH